MTHTHQVAGTADRTGQAEAVKEVKRRARHMWSESAQRDKPGPGTEVGTTHSDRGTLSKQRGGGVVSHPAIQVGGT